MRSPLPFPPARGREGPLGGRAGPSVAAFGGAGAPSEGALAAAGGVTLYGPLARSLATGAMLHQLRCGASVERLPRRRRRRALLLLPPPPPPPLLLLLWPAAAASSARGEPRGAGFATAWRHEGVWSSAAGSSSRWAESSVGRRPHYKYWGDPRRPLTCAHVPPRRAVQRVSEAWCILSHDGELLLRRLRASRSHVSRCRAEEGES
eukprot:scaffold5681_cov377-Prasinococcus_capsulatus_cf.AAC.10